MKQLEKRRVLPTPIYIIGVLSVPLNMLSSSQLIPRNYKNSRSTVILKSAMSRYVGLLFVLLFAGCTSLPNKPVLLTEAEKNVRWQKFQQQVLRADKWQFFARVALKVPGESITLSLDWAQNKDAYTLFFEGLFGLSLAKIKGDNTGAIAEVLNQDKPLKSLSPEQLVMQTTGWNLPVSNLQYWLRGLPVPDMESTVTLNDQDLASTIVQQGWKIVYHDYVDEKGIARPRKLNLDADNISLKLVIKRWH